MIATSRAAGTNSASSRPMNPIRAMDDGYMLSPLPTATVVYQSILHDLSPAPPTDTPTPPETPTETPTPEPPTDTPAPTGTPMPPPTDTPTPEPSRCTGRPTNGILHPSGSCHGRPLEPQIDDGKGAGLATGAELRRQGDPVVGKGLKSPWVKTPGKVGGKLSSRHSESSRRLSAERCARRRRPWRGGRRGRWTRSGCRRPGSGWCRDRAGFRAAPAEHRARR